MRHTEGPWSLDFGDDGAVVYKEGVATIANIPDDLQASSANARLIVEAPALLAALEEVQKVMLQVSATMGNPAMAHLLPFGLRERVDELSFKGIGAVVDRARGVSA